ncbi:galactosyl transferase [Francisella tularensis subsp. tularensis FSC033]|nr:glycosyltransferase [Francisella tularensis subsp. tularensis WY96-3418]ADA79105.1 glycosyltransferase [Francisella tularensis subsp. tularensis NE061598]AFB79490.1 Lipid carrier : UDP-N-acetylgalactosaminyltransferase [Francisella tularensis subsp. tularensis TIGB03]AFB81035.1 Lipid carrier : UDP-N-acetylgalactosaminyltransferase [Francisella tularensis subsp. tularensis TI0902]AKZ20446.1 Lipid carrier : UDP-N-acetylgalactosaminyltransferase [Francisella tularensis subsp. tularensis MA00-29
MGSGFMFYEVFKRLLDILLSFMGLLLLSPIFLIIIFMIKKDSKGPIFFKQKRYGKDKQFFYIYKFRTMYVDTPKDMPTHMLQDPSKCITKVGGFLRKSSLDELPQIINILKGEMSIVGPRPALWNQDDLIAQRDKYGANAVPVGLTGWAQINGRDELPIPDKAKLDGDYVKNKSTWFDLKCIFLTVFSVFAKKGVVEGGTGALGNKEDLK